MKDLKKIKEAKVISKIEQKAIKGGTCFCETDADCPEGYFCDWMLQINGICVAFPIPPEL